MEKDLDVLGGDVVLKLLELKLERRGLIGEGVFDECESVLKLF
jgi:hypothetical protein